MIAEVGLLAVLALKLKAPLCLVHSQKYRFGELFGFSFVPAVTPQPSPDALRSVIYRKGSAAGKTQG